MKHKIVLLIIGFLILGCGGRKGVITKKNKEVSSSEKVITTEEVKIIKPVLETKPTETRVKSSVDDYIAFYAEIAKEEMRKSKIPASITLAQGILESGSGNGRLAKEANNHFGIKCHGWEGAKIYHDDDSSQECFRKYSRVESSYKDHSEFLTGRKRYSKLFNLRPNDYKAWAKGLRAAGYATDKKYPQKLISLIERYKLFEYDNEVLKNVNLGLEEAPIVKSENRRHTVVKGETLYSLSVKYGITVNQIKIDNKLNSNDLSIGQVLIIK